MSVTLGDIKAAAARILCKVHRTDVRTCDTINKITEREIFFKCEMWQKTGSFKARGTVRGTVEGRGSVTDPLCICRCSERYPELAGGSPRVRGPDGGHPQLRQSRPGRGLGGEADREPLHCGGARGNAPGQGEEDTIIT